MSNRSTLLLEHHLKELRLPSFLRGCVTNRCHAGFSLLSIRWTIAI